MSSKVVGMLDTELFPSADCRGELPEWRTEGEDLKGTGGMDMRAWRGSDLSAYPLDELERISPWANWELRLRWPFASSPAHPDPLDLDENWPGESIKLVPSIDFARVVISASSIDEMSHMTPFMVVRLHFSAGGIGIIPSGIVIS